MAALDENWKPHDLGDVRAMLGEPEAEFRSDRAKFAAGVVACTVFMTIGVALLLRDADFCGELFDSAVAFVLLVFGVRGIWSLSRLWQLHLLVYSEWLVVVTAGRLRAIRWQEFKTIQHHSFGKLYVLEGPAEPLKFPDEGLKGTRQFIALASAKIAVARADLPANSGTVELSRVGIGRAGVDLSRFSAKAWQAIQAAEQIARDFLHDYVGTEHLLMALLRHRPNDAVRALEQCRIAPLHLEEMLKSAIEPGTFNGAKQKQLPFTPMLAKILRRAQTESQVGSDGTAAILMELLLEEDGVAGMVLANAGLTPDSLRDAARE